MEECNFCNFFFHFIYYKCHEKVFQNALKPFLEPKNDPEKLGNCLKNFNTLYLKSFKDGLIL